MATDHNFRIKNGLEVGGQLIVNSSGQLVVASVSSQLQFLDNVKAKFGNGSDLQIYHDGSNSFISEVGTGDLTISADNDLMFKDGSGNLMANMNASNSVELYFGNVKKFETTSGGVNIVGNILDIGGANPYIRGTHASAMRIKHTSGQTMYIRPDESGAVSFFEGSTGGSVYLMTSSPTVNDTANDSTSLYFQTRSKKADGTSQSRTAQIGHRTTGISTNNTELLFSGATNYRMDTGLWIGSTSGAHVFLNHSGGIEITRTAGNADPFIDFKDSASDDFDVRLQMDDNKFIIKTGGAGNIVTAATFDNNGRLYLSGQTGSYLDYNSTYLRHSTPYGYIEMGPGNGSHAHLMTDRPNFYFNTEIQVDGGIIGSHNENLTLRRAQNSATGQLILQEGKFIGTGQTASNLLNSSMIIGGFTANTGAEEAGNHFYIPGLSPNNLAGADRRLTVTITKNGSAYSAAGVGNMFNSTGSFGSFSQAVGTTDTIVITITGGSLTYAQYYGVQFGHPNFRAKSIEIENSTDSGANWTSIYNVADFPYSTVNHYHGGSGTSTNAIRYTFTDFASTGMRINQLFAYDYSESITHNLESYVDSTINANYRWNDGYRAKFGSSDDLQIYHSGTHSFIQDTGVGSLYLDTSGLIVRNPSDNANVIIATPTDVQLFAGGGTAKLQTASWGVLVNGILNADGLHIGAGATDLISVRHDSTATQIATYRNELGGFITRTYGDHGNDGALVEYQERVGVDGNYASIGTYGAHALQIRTGNLNRLDISSTGNVEVQGTGHLIAPTIRVTNDATDTTRHRVAVYDNSGTSYGMMLWNSNGTTGDWSTMIYGPNQNNRRISFGKVNSNTFTNHSHVTEAAHFDLDTNDLILNNGTLFANGASDGVVARKGTFGPSITALHGTYDLYNNGTTYLNGPTIVDAPLTVSDASSGIKVDSSGHASIRMDRGGVSSHNNLLYYTNGSLDWRIWQSNATHLRIRDEGAYPSNIMSFQSATAYAGDAKVGIHTDSPEFPVHIQGSVDGDFNVGIFNTKSYGTGTGTNETATLSLGIKEASATAAERIFGQIRVATIAESDSSTGKMTFHVRDGGTVTERATLSAAGNLNIDGGLYTSHINTGQGNTEVHLMNQNLRTTDSPTFATLNVTGDLNITGDINTVSVTDLDVQDKTITVAAGAASSSAADNAGLIIGGAGSKILWDHAEDKFQFSHGINFDRDTYSETNQNLGVYWSAWDKEAGGDQSDIAYIKHTEAVGGHLGSVLEIKSMNDSGDGIAFTTHAGSQLKHNSSNILTVANFTTNIPNLLTTTTNFSGDVTGTYNSLVIDVPIQTSAPTGSSGRLWWDEASGNLKIYNGSVWVTASAIPDVSTKYDKTGGAISGSVSITATLAVSGNITGSSTVQGATIVKTGGTSSQFLKADGTVDSSTYLTGNQTITLTGDASGSGTTTIPVVVANDSHNHSSSSGNFSVGGTLFVPQKIEHTSDSNTYMEFDSGDQWRVVTGGVERIRVIGGAVGIGDINPTDGDLTLNTPQLHVKGPDTSGAFNLVARFQGGNDSDNTGGAILINHSNDRGLLIEGGRSSSDRGVGYIGLLNSSAAHTRIMGFYQDGGTYTAGINIDPGTYPHTDLQVGNPETASTGITIAARYDQSNAKLTFRSGHPTTTNIWNTSQIASTDDGSYNGRLEFRTSTSSQAAPSTKMFIRANGRVGVGSGLFTPDTTLHVNGTFKVNQGSDYLGMQTTTVNSGNLWANWINGSETAFRMSLYNNGTGNSTSQYAFKFGLHYGGTANANIKFYRGGASTGGFLAFTTNDDTERMRITTDGDIGVNISTPESVLHLLDPGAADGQITLSGTYNSVEHNAGRLYFKHDAGWTTELRLGTASDHSASYRDELTVKAGKVGISNTTPDAQLHVKSVGASYSSGSIAAIFEDTTARATVRIRSINPNPAELFFDSGGATRWDFSTRGSSESYRLDLYGQGATPSYNGVAGPWITVLQSGYFGINDANPGNRLEVNEPISYKGIHVRGSNAPQITFGRGTNSAAEWKAGIAGSNGTSFSISSGTGNQDRLHIESNGEVGIGTSSPDALLEVNGSFKAKTVMLSGAQNFDNLAKSGFYNIYNGTAVGNTNAPFSYGSMLVVGNNKASGGFTMQLAHERTGGGTWIRGMNDTASTWYSWQRIFQDNYHPNADKWTTARSHTVTLNGAITGTATQSVDGTGNKTWTISTAYNGAYSETDTLATVTGRGATTSTQSSFNSGIITQANGIRLSRTQANSSIWFNGASATDSNHVLWNAGYGTTPTARPGTSGAFDGMMWNTLRGIKIRGGSAGAYNLIVASNSSGATNDHTVELFASNVKRFETTTSGAVIESTLLLGSYSDSAKQGKLILGGNVANKQAEIKCTNGNLHIDSENTSAIYLNYYEGTAGTAFGTGAGGVAAWMGPDGDLWKGSADNAGSRYFNDAYHPNADKWTTARTNTVTLTGDVTGSGNASVDGTGNWTVSIPAVVANNSHEHSNYVLKTGDTMTGVLNTRNNTVDDETLFAITDSDDTTSVRAKFYTTSTAITKVDDATAPASGVFKVTGAFNAVWGEYIPMDDETEIMFECWIKHVSGSDTAGNFYAGGEFYNGAKTSYGNTQRYWAANGDEHDSDTPNPPRWRHIKGVMHGGAIRSQSTTPDAQYVRLLVLANYNAAANASHFCGFRFYRSKKTISSLWLKTHNTTSGNQDSAWQDLEASTAINIIDNAGNITSPATITATGGNSTNWNTAYGWGNHASAGYTSNVGDITGVTAGNGLTGGGSSGTPTLHVGAGSGISVAADTVAVDSTVIRTTGNQSMSGTKTFTGALAVTASGNAITINGTSPTMLFNDTSGEDNFYIHINSNRFYVLADRDGTGGYETPHPLELNATTNIGYAFGSRLFTDAYHPNADKWTTLRTLFLTGDVTGSVNWDGSGNATMTTAVDSTIIRQGGTYALGNVTRFQSNDVLDTASGAQASLEVFQDNVGADAFMSFHVNGDYAAYFGLHGGINDFVVGGWSKGAGYQRVFHDGYHPNADVWTTARTATVTLTGDATGTAGVSVNGSGNWTNSIAVNVNNIDGQAFINTRENSPQSVQGVNGNGIYYYNSGTDNFSGNATDGAAYQQSFSDTWRHTINGDYRSGAIAVKSRNNGTWQETKRIPMIFTGSTTPTITNHADNCELWFDTSVGKLKFYYNDGVTTEWVDAAAVPSISNLYSKGGGTISGSVSILNTLNVVGITELDNDLFVDKLAGANGTSNQLARFSNITSGATSGYIYLGASTGVDWKIGKNVPGTLNRTNFDIATNGNVVAMSIDGSNNAQFFGAEISGTDVGTGAARTHLKRIGGIYLGWYPGYGTQDNHSIKSTYGTTYGDDITINSYHHMRFNIDTNANNADEVFQVGRHTTGTGNILMTLDTSGNFSTTGNVTAYSSDRRLKKNFKPIENPLDKVLSLNGYNFDWRMEKLEGTTFEPEYETNDVGLIAQEVQAVCEQAAGPAPFDIQYNEETKKHESQSGEDYLTVNYDKLVPLLVEAIKEQNNTINKLEQRINALEKGKD